MAKEFFTLDEVNELIPQLEYHFRKLLQHKQEMAKGSNQLRKLGATPQLIGRVPNEAHPEVHKIQAEVRGHYRNFKQELFAIESIGGEIKDLELGRVDFPSKKDGEDVILTWQLGVTDGACLMPTEKEEEGEKIIHVEWRPETPI